MRERRLGVLRVERPAGEAAARRQPHRRSAPACPARQRCFAATVTRWSHAQEMKSANCISATGRMPIIAAPVQPPTIAVSRERRVDHAPGAELLLEAERHLERAAVDADVLADHEDALVAAHLLAEAVADRLEVGLLGHLLVVRRVEVLGRRVDALEQLGRIGQRRLLGALRARRSAASSRRPGSRPPPRR